MKLRFVLLALVSLLAGCSSLSSPTSRDETQIRYLSGHGSDDPVLWNFYCNDGRKAGVWTTIKVPSCWEQEGFGAYNYGMELRGAGADRVFDRMTDFGMEGQRV